MPRRPSTTFTDRELEIMQVIWELGEATAREIQERLPGDRHYNSVMTIIRVLERKGHLLHRAEDRAHIYRARVSHEKSRGHALRHLISNVFGGSPASLVLHLVEAGELNEDDLKQARRKLSELAKKKERKS
ncbi:MAG TPA: BlaI/MecI/CopY family transcriptional regulator [Blastocatellia bacterium]|nr:BlaI/MecI/CopY family transcriptional regulator [Blastocatellia bacterium]